MSSSNVVNQSVPIELALDAAKEWKQGNYKKAKMYIMLSIEHFKILKKDPKYANAFNATTKFKSRLDDLIKQTKSYNNDNFNMTSSNQAIQLSLNSREAWEKGEYKKAKEYINKSIELFEILKDIDPDPKYTNAFNSTTKFKKLLDQLINQQKSGINAISDLIERQKQYIHAHPELYNDAHGKRGYLRAADLKKPSEAIKQMVKELNATVMAAKSNTAHEENVTIGSNNKEQNEPHVTLERPNLGGTRHKRNHKRRTYRKRRTLRKRNTKKSF